MDSLEKFEKYAGCYDILVQGDDTIMRMRKVDELNTRVEVYKNNVKIYDDKIYKSNYLWIIAKIFGCNNVKIIKGDNNG